MIAFKTVFFAKLPISIIYRIFSKSEIENISSDLLFDFINASVEERYVLFHFLNIGKLNDGKFDMLYKKYQIESKSKFIYQNIPVDLYYIKSMKDENASLKKYIENLEKQVKKLINEKEINNTNHQIEISKLRAEKNQILNNTIQLKKEIKALVDEKEKNNINHQIEISKIRDENIQLKKEIKEIETDNKKYQTEIDEVNKRGIFQYLKHLGSDLIEITASSLHEGSPQNAIIYDDESKIFYSQNYENSWLTFHFKKHKIIPLAYTIKRTHIYAHPVNWIIEGSNDNKNWKEINQQNNCKALNEYKPFTFNIDIRESFRFIKMTMIGKNSSGMTYCLIIESFEIYGIIISI